MKKTNQSIPEIIIAGNNLVARRVQFDVRAQKRRGDRSRG